MASLQRDRLLRQTAGPHESEDLLALLLRLLLVRDHGQHCLDVPHITAGRAGCTRAGAGSTPSFTSSGAGTWHNYQTLQVGGRTRYYSVYVPNGTPTGVMFFLHGTGATVGSSGETEELDQAQGQLRGFQVSQRADEFGFIAVVPLGVPISEASGCGSSKR